MQVLFLQAHVTLYREAAVPALDVAAHGPAESAGCAALPAVAALETVVVAAAATRGGLAASETSPLSTAAPDQYRADTAAAVIGAANLRLDVAPTTTTA